MANVQNPTNAGAFFGIKLRPVSRLDMAGMPPIDSNQNTETQTSALTINIEPPSPTSPKPAEKHVRFAPTPTSITTTSDNIEANEQDLEDVSGDTENNLVDLSTLLDDPTHAQSVAQSYVELFEKNERREVFNEDDIQLAFNLGNWLDSRSKDQGNSQENIQNLMLWSAAFKTLLIENTKIPNPTPSAHAFNAQFRHAVTDKKNQSNFVKFASQTSRFFTSPFGKIVTACVITAIAIGLSFASFGAVPAALAVAAVVTFTLSLAAQFLFRKEKLGFDLTGNFTGQFFARTGRLLPQSNIGKCVAALGFLALIGITIGLAAAFPPAAALLPWQIGLASAAIGVLTTVWPMMVRGVEKACALHRHPEGSPIKRIGTRPSTYFENYDRISEWEIKDITFGRQQPLLSHFGAMPRRRKEKDIPVAVEPVLSSTLSTPSNSL